MWRTGVLAIFICLRLHKLLNSINFCVIIYGGPLLIVKQKGTTFFSDLKFSEKNYVNNQNIIQCQCQYVEFNKILFFVNRCSTWRSFGFKHLLPYSKINVEILNHIWFLELHAFTSASCLRLWLKLSPWLFLWQNPIRGSQGESCLVITNINVTASPSTSKQYIRISIIEKITCISTVMWWHTVLPKPK